MINVRMLHSDLVIQASVMANHAESLRTTIKLPNGNLNVEIDAQVRALSASARAYTHAAVMVLQTAGWPDLYAHRATTYLLSRHTGQPKVWR